MGTDESLRASRDIVGTVSYGRDQPTWPPKRHQCVSPELTMLPSNSPAKLPVWQPVRMLIHWCFKGPVLHLQTRLDVNEQTNRCSWGSGFCLLSWLLTSSPRHSQGFRIEVYWDYLARFWQQGGCRGCIYEKKPGTALCWTQMVPVRSDGPIAGHS